MDNEIEENFWTMLLSKSDAKSGMDRNATLGFKTFDDTGVRSGVRR